MAKLSARELKVVTNSIFEKVEIKKEESKLTQEYLDVETTVKDEVKYSELISLIRDYQSIEKQIDELQNQRISMGVQMSSQKITYPYNVSSLDSIVEQKVNALLGNNFPTKAKIENEIILLSLSGSNDIITSILTKFNLL